MAHYRKELHLDLHGSHVTVRGPEATVGEIALDFSFFQAPRAGRGSDISVLLSTPELPAKAKFMFSWKSCRIYLRPDGKRLVVYPGGASCLCDYRTEMFELRTAAPALARELCYLLILSRAGEALDLRGLHRLHAGAAAIEGSPLLFCGPQGTGKTTLLIELLKRPGFSLLSDDTPLISRNGTVYPFPLRLGIGEDNPHFASMSGLRPFKRRDYADKFLMQKWVPPPGQAKPVRCGYFFLLKKGRAPALRRLSKAGAWAEAARSLVLGCGVPQMGEYFIRLSPEQLLAKSGILLSRLKAAAGLINSSMLWQFETGPVPADNAAALSVFFDKNSGEGSHFRKEFP